MKTTRFAGWTAAMMLAVAARGQTLVDYNFTGINGDIPDGDLSGFASAQSVTTSQTLITGLTVTLNLAGTGSGGFNGDMYAYLAHDGQVAVLLNRAGRTSTDPSNLGSYGYADNGFSSVTFSDTAADDAHTYQNITVPAGNGPLTGTWQPDGRNVLPGNVTDASSRGAFLGNFTGHNVNGTWTLYVVDAHTGGTERLTDWSLHVTAVPEPATFGLAASALLLGFAAWRKGR